MCSLLRWSHKQELLFILNPNFNQGCFYQFAPYVTRAATLDSVLSNSRFFSRATPLLKIIHGQGWMYTAF